MRVARPIFVFINLGAAVVVAMTKQRGLAAQIGVLVTLLTSRNEGIAAVSIRERTLLDRDVRTCCD